MVGVLTRPQQVQFANPSGPRRSEPTFRNRYRQREFARRRGKTFKSALKSKPLVISPEEEVNIDGYVVPAYPTFTVKTPLLRVNGFELSEKGKDEVATFYLSNEKAKKKNHQTRAEETQSRRHGASCGGR